MNQVKPHYPEALVTYGPPQRRNSQPTMPRGQFSSPSQQKSYYPAQTRAYTPLQPRRYAPVRHGIYSQPQVRRFAILQNLEFRFSFSQTDKTRKTFVLKYHEYYGSFEVSCSVDFRDSSNFSDL